MRAAPRSCRSVRTARSATAFPWRSDMKARVLELLILLPTPYSLLLEVQRDLHNVDGCPIFGRLLKDNQGSASGLLYIKGYRHIKGPRVPEPELAITICSAMIRPSQFTMFTWNTASKVLAVPVMRRGLCTVSPMAGDSTSIAGVTSPS